MISIMAVKLKKFVYYIQTVYNFWKTMKSTFYTITRSLKIQEYLLVLCGREDN